MTAYFAQIAAENEADKLKKPFPFTAMAMLFFTGAWFLIALPTLTDASISFAAFCLLVPLSILAGSFWVVGTVMVFFGKSRYEPWLTRAWTCCTAVGLFTVVASHPLVGFRARVWLSASALERFAQSRPPNAFSSEDQWVGLFYVLEYETTADGTVAMKTARDGMMNQAGILYRPVGSSPPLAARTREHLFGPWHRAWWKF